MVSIGHTGEGDPASSQSHALAVLLGSAKVFGAREIGSSNDIDRGVGGFPRLDDGGA
jgi:hypothetical protein